MRFLRHYSLPRLMAATVASVIAAIAGFAFVRPYWLFSLLVPAARNGKPAIEPSYAIYAPGILVAACLLGIAVIEPRRAMAALLGVAAALASLESPYALAWTTWNIQGDHTANIGAGLLLLVQPVMSPLLSLLVFFVVEGLRNLIGGVSCEAEARADR